METKIFGKYHELALLTLGFILTTVVGGGLGIYFQRQAWKQQQLVEEKRIERRSATQIFEEVSSLMDRRSYRMILLNWRLMHNSGLERTKAQMDEYRKILYEWNDSQNRNKALIRRYFGSEMSSYFAKEIHGCFKQIGCHLEAYYATPLEERSSEKGDKIGEDMGGLEEKILEFNLKMMALIQKEEIGMFHPEYREDAR